MHFTDSYKERIDLELARTLCKEFEHVDGNEYYLVTSAEKMQILVSNEELDDVYYVLDNSTFSRNEAWEEENERRIQNEIEIIKMQGKDMKRRKDSLYAFLLLITAGVIVYALFGR